MMKTALSIIQDVMYRFNLSNVPDALFGETDPNTLQLLHTLYAVCEELRQAGIWSVQKRAFEFDTEVDRIQYSLPKDYYMPLLSTHWNNDEKWPLIGPVSDERYNWHVRSDYSASHNYIYRIFGWDGNSNTELGQFYVNPTPGEAQTLSYDYITRHLFLPQNWEPETTYAADTDYVNVNGNIYLCKTDGDSSADDPPSGQTTAITDGTAKWDYYNVPYEELKADTDLCLFDYDLVKLGIRAKWSGEKRGDIYSEKAEREYEGKIEKAIARYKGSFKGSMARRAIEPRYSIPWRNWSL